jgi:hypothetical protein
MSPSCFLKHEVLRKIIVRAAKNISTNNSFAATMRDKFASGSFLVGTATFPNTGPDTSLTLVQVFLAKNRTYGLPPVERKTVPARDVEQKPLPNFSMPSRFLCKEEQ